MVHGDSHVNFLCYNGQPAAADGTELFRAAWDLKVPDCLLGGGGGGGNLRIESILRTGLVFQMERVSFL